MLRFSFLLFLLSTSTCIAGPVAFGIEVGKTSLQEVQNEIQLQTKYVQEESGFTRYMASSEAIEKLKMPGLLSVIFYVNEQKMVEGVRAFFDKKSHSRIHDLLIKKYRLVKDELPVLGNKRTIMVSEGGYVVLYSPHLSFEMNVIYATEKLIDVAESSHRQFSDKSQERLNNNL